ncbi:MAG TPA: CAP domain-containing protein [Candidatus Paceibacterota bacterium]|nr:CAP domain-containing protein [Candidatus Pacearchaeota archaeon]HRZ50575.1 CAP domain-containing protein [Candidatus Paceibacterota bacterium]HSA36296.1 CAP domain-containing protein [Candidatus Paceibacterota bacterium]
MLLELAAAAAKKTKIFLFPCKENGQRAGIFAGPFLMFFLIAVLVLKVFAASFLVYFPKSSYFADITKTALVQLTNEERAKLGLPALTENPVLDRAAYLKAQDMLNRGYFSHFSPAGVSPWYWFKLSGYNYRYAGENLAIGFLDSSEVNDAWIDSPSHKANILNNKYKEVGIAVVTGNFQGANTTIVVQLFGSKQQVLGAKTVNPAVNQEKPNLASELQKKYPESGEPKASVPSYEQVLGTQDSREGLKFNLMSFVAKDYYDFLEYIIYSAIIFIILLLSANLFLNFDFQHKDLFIKAAAFVVLLLIFVALDKGVLLDIIPHTLSIY